MCTQFIAWYDLRRMASSMAASKLYSMPDELGSTEETRATRNLRPTGVGTVEKPQERMSTLGSGTHEVDRAKGWGSRC